MHLLRRKPKIIRHNQQIQNSQVLEIFYSIKEKKAFLVVEHQLNLLPRKMVLIQKKGNIYLNILSINHQFQTSERQNLFV